VPQLFDFIKTGGLQFGRWLKQAPYHPSCGIMAHIPQYSSMSQLSLLEQYASVELFRGTMLRHSAVIYRNDYPGKPQPVDFTSDSWQDYVPIRMPDTICVQKRLPPGASAVLINRTHTYTDLYLPINAQEKKLFDAIDGKLTIAEIGQNHGNSDTAHTLFERLWWYDQVVFDTVCLNG
jgi:hypothetical protein